MWIINLGKLNLKKKRIGLLEIKPMNMQNICISNINILIKFCVSILPTWKREYIKIKYYFPAINWKRRTGTTRKWSNWWLPSQISTKFVSLLIGLQWNCARCRNDYAVRFYFYIFIFWEIQIDDLISLIAFLKQIYF